MDSLSSQQKDKFAALNARLGLGPMEFTTADTFAGKAAHEIPSILKMSSGSDSHYTPHKISVGSIDEMRTLIGAPHGGTLHDGQEPVAPAPITAEDVQKVLATPKNQLKASLSDDLHKNLADAASYYVFAKDPSAVESWVPLINAALYPSEALAFTASTLTVPDNTTLVLSDDAPICLNVGTLALGEGSTITIMTPFSVNAQRTCSV